ncbi:MAG: bifunctional UDP-N-acetylglucosamine diphosphorylase/glucosamine-1-phosphate N-acetyltransferase GlmU [Chloroflexi bacterium]|nr:bifunctional UDP-N-acetylglucosamine diphosphorylase/glucosamine-1-phosphate N-acetyltransferase GlmU [Chloroflexota bacterium]
MSGSGATVALVLAAGLGTRMRSKTPKVLHPIAGKPLLAHVLDTCAAVGARAVLVLSKESEPDRALANGATVVLQEPPRGTGDAVQVALRAVTEQAGTAFVLYGDTALVRPETLTRMRALLTERGAVMALMTADGGSDNAYGRVVRGPQGDVERIVEARFASADELRIPEANLGAYAIDLAWLRSAAAELTMNETGEVFLTDLVAIARRRGDTVAAHRLGDADEGHGVNTRVELAHADAVLKRRIRERHMLNGVTFVDPESSSVDAGVEIGPDALILRGSILEGTTVVGSGTRIGPYSIVRDTKIGAGCVVEASVLEGATLEDEVRIGPFSHLRPGAYLERGVELGNFGEVKNARLRTKTKMHHFSYVGDADIGERVNIGAGTITLNYDGVAKHRTTVGNDAFIGSDTLLRAPVTIGEGAATGAGAVVTKDVPPGMLAVGMPARSIKKRTPPKK